MRLYSRAARTYSWVRSMRETPSSSVERATGTWAARYSGKRVEGRHDAEDDVVRGEVDLDHDVAVGHLCEQQAWGSVFVHDVHAVADALGVAEVDGLADVEAEAGGRNKAGGELSGVQRDVDLG